MVGSRQGFSLVELLVCLLLLELAGVAALTTAITSYRLTRTVAAGSATDRGRLEAVRAAAASVACRSATVPTVSAIALSGTPERPPLTAAVRCGP